MFDAFVELILSNKVNYCALFRRFEIHTLIFVLVLYKCFGKIIAVRSRICVKKCSTGVFHFGNEGKLFLLDIQIKI